MKTHKPKQKSKKIVNKGLTQRARKLVEQEYRLCKFRWHPGMDDKAIALRSFELKTRHAAFEEVEKIKETKTEIIVYTALKDASGEWMKESLWSPSSVMKCLKSSN